MTSLKTATIFLIFFAILSKILGIAREIITAYLFGTTSSLDAYLIGATIPNFIMHLIVGSTFLVAFIPVFNKSIAKNEEEQAWRFASNIINLSIIIFGIILTPITILLAPLIVKLFAPGFSESTFNLSVSLTRVMLPSMVFFVLTTISQGILNSYEHFTTPGLKSTTLNLTIVLVMILGYKTFGIYSLAVGFLFASILQLLVQLPALIPRIKNYFFSIDFSDRNLQNFIGLFLPLTLVMGINQLNILVDRMIASTLSEGSISALNYSSHLMQTSENIFGVSLATVIFPRLTSTSYKGDWSQFENLLSKCLNVLFYSTLPVTFGFIFFGKPIITILFQRGFFDTASTNITNYALFYYSFAAFFMSANYVLIRTLYALEKIKITVVISSISLILNIILNILLSRLIGIGGITLATTISSGVLFLMAINIITKHIQIKDFEKICRKFFLIFIIELVSFFIGWVIYSSLKYSYILNFVISISISFLIMVLFSEMFRIEEYLLVKEIFVSKFSKKKLEV
ncbi:MAG: murein biosynthesis integral membrane protein MurJ [Endomicrobiia bacterium]